MIRFRLGTSVFQSRRTAVIYVILRVIVVLVIGYFLLKHIYTMLPSKTSTLFQTDIEKEELTLLQQRLAKLEEELLRNKMVLAQVKNSVKDWIKVKPNQKTKKDSSTLRPTKFNRTYVVLPHTDCQLRLASPAVADENVLDIYEQIEFDNQDGGVWKQGWNIEYEPEQWSSINKLKIFVVPHSHNDPGWIKTFDKYFKDQTKHILNNMVLKMKDDKRRKFIWAEISFFASWWDLVDQNAKHLVKRFIDDGQLEFVTGGWVMNDEATTHYYAMIEQMVEGHQWLEHNLDYRPKNGWAIDPFGLSPTMAYLLRRMGLDNMVIQRVHYSIKKYLAQKKSLEFLWRQLWDHNHTMDILCHLMPFYSYDIPHTCGPDPKICCQYDFKRLPGNKVNCPWRIPPTPITPKNVEEKARILLDQYRKKSQLFRTNVVMIQLGDDFRYDKITEWDQQFNNYQKLFDFINTKEEWHAEAKFGTLEDYFSSLREESGTDSRNMPLNFPSLSGDFFTYADRDDHYWSGYYTSRPYYKNMDRTLEAYLRGAEILYSLMWANICKSGALSTSIADVLMNDLVYSRRTLSLFQHHDAITGTSKDHVVQDYATRMLTALEKLQNVISRSASYLLLPDPDEFKFPEQTVLQSDEYHQPHTAMPKKNKIEFTSHSSSRRFVLFNSLSHSRKELVSMHISISSVRVIDGLGNTVPCQINPVFQGSVFVENEYELLFIADIPAIGLSTYSVEETADDDISSNKASLTFLNSDTLPNNNEFTMQHLKSSPEFTITSSSVTATFSASDGLLQQLVLNHENISVNVKIQFLKYGTRTKGKDKSGAYLFLPDDEAKILEIDNPEIRVLEGPLMSEVTVFLPYVEHHIYLKNSPGLDGVGLDIYNEIDITKDTNQELIMRFQTNITNENFDFYTDLNGLQIIKRHIFNKLPIQANVYPITSMAYFGDEKIRFSLLTGHSLGVTSVQPGVLELFMDRRLNQDDNRGLQQGVTDNKKTPMHFRVIVEKISKTFAETSSSYPSLLIHHASLSLLHPVMNLAVSEEVPLQTFYSPIGSELPCDVHLLNLRTLINPPYGNSLYTPSNSTSLYLHRFGFDCSFKLWGVSCSSNNGTVAVDSLFPKLFGSTVEEASLSLMYTGSKFHREAHIQLPSMEIVTLKLSTR